MQSKGLESIDENTSSSLANGDNKMLPCLLSRHAPENAGCISDKTPESWPRRASCGEATPETWSPMVYGTESRVWNSFGLGDETPESWPEYTPSFQMCPSQPSNCQSVPAQVSMFPSVIPMAGMWPAHAAYPFGMVFDGNAPNVACMGVPMVPPAQNDAAFAQTVNGTADNTSTTSASSNAAMSQAPKSTSGKKESAGLASKAVDGTDAACPVAVYVDLSSLRERGADKRNSRR
jgi:hypothetical protein